MAKNKGFADGKQKSERSKRTQAGIIVEGRWPPNRVALPAASKWITRYWGAEVKEKWRARKSF